MELLEIKGGRPLNGVVKVSGAKNEVTKLMVAATLFNRPLTILNVPEIGDVDVTIDLLSGLGVKVEYQRAEQRLVVDPTHLNRSTAAFSHSQGNRLSVLLAGPLLHRFGKAVVQKPGGCQIGERPLDLHLYYLQRLGVEIKENDQELKLSGELRGNTIDFPYKSVGATEGALLAAVYARGNTIIKNGAQEPEIGGLIEALQASGALIEFDVMGTIHVTGIKRSLSIDYPITVIGDRLEAISYAIAASTTKGHIVLEGINQAHVITPLTVLRKIGVEIDIDRDHIHIGPPKSKFSPLNLETDPYPSLPTDTQQAMAVLLSQANGTSYLHETVFEDRFACLEQLNILGGDFSVSNYCTPFLTCRFSATHPHTAKINGPVAYHGGEAKITDLRASFALIIAGLLAPSVTRLSNVHHLLRGYDHPIDKLAALGAEIRLVS